MLTNLAAVSSDEAETASADNYLSTPLLALEPGLDADRDGMSNAAELIAGTNPLDPTSVFRILSASHSDGVMHIVFSSVEGRRYQLQRRAGFTPGPWTALNEILPGNGEALSVTDDLPQSDRTTVYRVVIVP